MTRKSYQLIQMKTHDQLKQSQHFVTASEHEGDFRFMNVRGWTESFVAVM